MKSKIFIYTFWLLSIADIAANAFDYMALNWILKPLLVPCLIFLFVRNMIRVKSNVSRFMVLGLFFCWMGDIFLMFEQSSPSYFVFGLASFLCGHLCYILYFSKLGPLQAAPKKSLMLLPIGLYVFALLYILYPTLGALKIPVLIYAIVLAAMLSMAVFQYQKKGFKAGRFFVAGAASFVLSDSLLAINKFYHSFPQAGMFIMFTYCLAQYLLVIGGIKVFSKKELSVLNLNNQL